jgi:hypothetical protein
LPEYLDVLTGAYGSPLAEADFAADVEAQRQVINGWHPRRSRDRRGDGGIARADGQRQPAIPLCHP